MEKNTPLPVTVDEYLMEFPEGVKQQLEKIRAVIKENAPGSTERISYQMPGFFLNGSLVWFAAYKGHIGFYPTGSAIQAFKEELLPYKTSKGAVQFPLDGSVPYDLIARMVQFRVAENIGRKSQS